VDLDVGHAGLHQRKLQADDVLHVPLAEDLQKYNPE
jgi:hypothetical protein